MSWARRRKLFIFALCALVLLPIVGYVVYPYVNVAPSCRDKKMNGDEEGVDCGGHCKFLCSQNLAPLSVEFTRSLTLLPGVYTAIAYVTNSNPQAFADTVPYTIALYDKNNFFLAEKKGTTFILPGRTTPIVETNIRVGERVPVRAFLTLNKTPPMQNIKNYTAVTLIASDVHLRDHDTLPRLEARISNPTLRNITGVEVSAVIFDTKGNVQAASHSTLSVISPGESGTVVFTWPSPFTFMVGKIDIIPRVRPL